MSTRFLKTKQQGKSRELITMVDYLAMFITPHNTKKQHFQVTTNDSVVYCIGN